MRQTNYFLAIALVLFFASPSLSGAQAVSYWCGTGQTAYWSSQPCASTYGNYGYGYTGYIAPQSYYYPYNYYQYPYGYQYPNYYAAPAPYCSITYTNLSLLGGYGGYSGYYGYGASGIRLQWSASNATAAYLSPGIGAVATFGTTDVYPAQTTTYTLSVQGQGGTNTCQTTYYQPYYQYYNQYQYPYNYYGYPYYGYQNYNYNYPYYYGYPYYGYQY